MIRGILVDDEPLSLQLMEKKLQSIGGIEIVGVYHNVESALSEIESLDFQVAFLDIEMSGLSGLDLAEMIMEYNSQIHIVFVTAYRDYAIQAFELDSLDYLLKPVMKDRLEKTVARIKEKVQMEHQKNVHIKQEKYPSLKIYCLDEFSVFVGDEPMKWKTSKVKEVFAFFVQHQNSYVNRDIMIDQIWPDQEYKKAKIQLHTSISHLRKTLEAAGFAHPISFSNQSYILNLSNFYCDAIELNQIMENYPSITKDNISILERLLTLYTGEYMEKNEYAWAQPKAMIIRDKVFHTLQKMIDYYTDIKEHSKKKHCLKLLMKYDPYSENVLRQLITLYLEEGNRTEALYTYQGFTNLLKEELGIEPEPSTKALYQLIQKGLKSFE